MQYYCNSNIMKTVDKTVQGSIGRLTKIKKAIINLLLENHCLLSRQELIDRLKAKKIYPDPSTIYRELKFLTNNGVIIKNTISGTDYYEIPKEHHHHLVCLKCKSIYMVKMDNHLEKQEEQIAKQNNFNIINHSLEFYGYCHRCQA